MGPEKQWRTVVARPKRQTLPREGLESGRCHQLVDEITSHSVRIVNVLAIPVVGHVGIRQTRAAGRGERQHVSAERMRGEVDVRAT